MNAMHEDMQGLVWRTFKFSNDFGSAMRRNVFLVGQVTRRQDCRRTSLLLPTPSAKKK